MFEKFSVAWLVGGVLAVLGALLMWSHAVQRRRYQADAKLDEADRLHLESRYRRRMRTSALIVVLGILLGLGDSPLVWKRGPMASSIYWLAVLVLTLYMLASGVGDLLVTRAHGRGALARLRQKRRELEDEAARLARTHRSNGHGGANR